MSDMIPAWFETDLSDEELAYELDKAAGMAPTREEQRRPTCTPARITRAVFNEEYVPDQIRRYTLDKVAAIKNRNRGR